MRVGICSAPSTAHTSPFCILKGHRSKFLNFDIFLSLKIAFILAKSALTLMNCHIMLHFIWVFTVCQSTSLNPFCIKFVTIYISAHNFVILYFYKEIKFKLKYQFMGIHNK